MRASSVSWPGFPFCGSRLNPGRLIGTATAPVQPPPRLTGGLGQRRAPGRSRAAGTRPVRLAAVWAGSGLVAPAALHRLLGRRQRADDKCHPRFVFRTGRTRIDWLIDIFIMQINRFWWQFVILGFPVPLPRMTNRHRRRCPAGRSGSWMPDRSLELHRPRALRVANCHSRKCWFPVRAPRVAIRHPRCLGRCRPGLEGGHAQPSGPVGRRWRRALVAGQ